MQDFFQDLLPCFLARNQQLTSPQQIVHPTLPQPVSTALLPHSLARAPWQRMSHELGWKHVGLDAWLDAC